MYTESQPQLSRKYDCASLINNTNIITHLAQVYLLQLAEGTKQMPLKVSYQSSLEVTTGQVPSARPVTSQAHKP